MQLSGKSAEEIAVGDTNASNDTLVKIEDDHGSSNTPPETEAPPDAPAKLEEDTTVKTPEDVSMEGRKLHYTDIPNYTPYVVTKLESDTNKALLASVENTDDISDTDKALIASVENTDDISNTDKALIASISGTAAKIASKTDNMNKDEEVTTLTNIVNVMRITVNAQSKNQALLQEAFDEERIMNRKFRDSFKEKIDDAIANLMHVVERHIEEQLEQHLNFINKESAITNAFLGNQAREIREFQAHTQVQFQNIIDSLAELRSSIESCRGDTCTSEEQSYVGEDEDEESHMSFYASDDDVPICQVESCSKKAFLDKTGYSPACSRYCYRLLTGNSPINRSDPQKRSLGVDSKSRHSSSSRHGGLGYESRYANPRQRKHTKTSPHHRARKFDSKGADEDRHGYQGSPPSSTYMEDDVSALDGHSLGPSLRSFSRVPSAAPRSKGVSPATVDYINKNTKLEIYKHQQMTVSVPTLSITDKQNFKFKCEINFSLRTAVGGNLEGTNFNKLVESLNRTLKLKNQGYVTEPNACARVLEVLTQCLNACISVDNDSLANDILDKINLIKKNPDTYVEIIDIGFASKLRSCSSTYDTIATMNHVDQTVAETMSSGVTKYLQSYGDRISELPPTPPDKALQFLGITCLTVQCLKVILKLIGFANKAFLAKLIVNLQNISITRSQWRSYKTLVTYYHSQLKTMILICHLFPELVATNTAMALNETFFDSLVEALKATPSANDISKLPFAHDNTTFLLRLNQFVKDNEDEPLSSIMPRFIALLEEIEIDSTAPKVDTFNTPQNNGRRTTRTPAVAGVVMEGDSHDAPPPWNQNRSKIPNRKSTKANTTTDSERKVTFCTSCGGNRNPDANKTCVKNITGDVHCPFKDEYFDMLNSAGGIHPTSGDALKALKGYVCHLCGCGGHGSKFCPYTSRVQKDGRQAQAKIVDAVRLSLQSTHKKSSSMGARVPLTKPAWADLDCEEDIDNDDDDIDDDDIDGLTDTNGKLKPNDGENYMLAVSGKKNANGTFKMHWKRSA